MSEGSEGALSTPVSTHAPKVAVTAKGRANKRNVSGVFSGRSAWVAVGKLAIGCDSIGSKWE